MMKRHFSVITPQQAPTPRAAWHLSASGSTMDAVTAHWNKPGSHHSARPSISSVDAVLPGLPNRLRRSQGPKPSVRRGEGRGAMGSKPAASALIHRSLIAARRLYQFMIPEVDSEVVR